MLDFQLEAGPHISLESRVESAKSMRGSLEMKMTKCLSLPTLWDIEVTASRSLSGQELGQALGPWSARQCGAVWLRCKR